MLLDARQIAWARGVNPHTILIAGDPGHVIVIVASDLRADLLVIGTKPRLLPGRVAARRGPWVHAYAPCPVLTVSSAPPKPARAALEPILVTRADHAPPSNSATRSWPGNPAAPTA